MKRQRAEPPSALWLGVSVFWHAAVLIGFAWYGGGFRARAGENGSGGANSEVDAVEVTFLAPHSSTASNESAQESEPSDSVEGAPLRERGSTRPLTTERSTTLVPHTTADANSDSSAASDTETNTAAEPDPEASSASGDDTTESGDVNSEDALARARATILGASGRLEGSAVHTAELLGQRIACTDPVAGTWVAYRYSPEYRDWARFTLHIDRNESRLEGTIVARMWRGMASDRNPPACSPEGWDYTVTMQATGNLIGDQLAFGSNAHRVSSVACASTFFSYNPDHFTGSVDGIGDRMHTVNNDGGRDINAAYEFRRLRCD